MKKTYYLEVGYTNLKFVNSLNLKDYYLYPSKDLDKYLHRWLEVENNQVYLLNNNLDLVTIIKKYESNPNLVVIKKQQLIHALIKNDQVNYEQMGDDLLMMNYYVLKKLNHYQNVVLYAFGTAIVGMKFKAGILDQIFISPNLTDINDLAIKKFHLPDLEANKILIKNHQINNLSALYQMNRLIILGYLQIFNDGNDPIIFTGNGAIKIVDYFQLAFDYTYLKDLVLNGLVEFVNSELLSDHKKHS